MLHNHSIIIKVVILYYLPSFVHSLIRIFPKSKEIIIFFSRNGTFQWSNVMFVLKKIMFLAEPGVLRQRL